MPEIISMYKSEYLILVGTGFSKIVKGKPYTLCGTPAYLVYYGHVKFYYIRCSQVLKHYDDDP